MKKKLALILALVMLFALAACGNGGDDNNQANNTTNPGTNQNENQNNNQGEENNAPETPLGPEVSGDPIKVGHIVDLTGVESLTGSEASKAMKFAKEYFEKYLGGINGRPIEIVERDSQSNASVAADVARELVEQQNVVAILGPTQVGHKNTVAAYISESGHIPLLLYNPTPAFMVSSNEYVISGGGGTSQFPTVMADYMYNTLGYRTINTLAMDNAGGHSYMDSLIENFEAMGGKVTSQWHPVPCPDFAPYMTGLDSSADALVCWTSGSDSIALWNAWYDMGVSDQMPIVASMHGGFTDYYICDEVTSANPDLAAAMVGTYAPMMYTYSFNSEENNTFVEAWKAEFGTVPPGTNLPGACYQALLTLKTAIENIDGDTSAENLYAALQETEVSGPEGHQTFSSGRAATKDIHVVQIVQLEDGSFNYEIVETYHDVPPAGLTVN